MWYVVLICASLGKRGANSLARETPKMFKFSILILSAFVEFILKQSLCLTRRTLMLQTSTSDVSREVGSSLYPGAPGPGQHGQRSGRVGGRCDVAQAILTLLGCGPQEYGAFTHIRSKGKCINCDVVTMGFRANDLHPHPTARMCVSGKNRIITSVF